MEFQVLGGLDVECHPYAANTQLLLSVTNQQQAEHNFCETMVIVQNSLKKGKLISNAGKTECMIH